MKTKNKKHGRSIVGQRIHNSHALQRIRKLFPKVNQIEESKVPLLVTVLPEDSQTGTKKDPANCALVRACVRLHIADGAIIGIGTSYLIKGNVATRYKTSTTVGREITSFDRHKDFAAGKNYRLSAISPSASFAAGDARYATAKRKKERDRARDKRRTDQHRAQPPIAVHAPAHYHYTEDVRKLK